MKYLRTLFFLIAGLSFVALWAQEEMEEFNSANAFYQNDDFDEAIKQYSSLLNKGYISTDLHYNLANAYFRNNQLAKAILHYEKALKIDPSNEDAKHNLEFANSKTIDKIESPPKLFFYRWWSAIVHSFSIKDWTFFIFLFLAFGLGGLGIYFFFSDSFIKRVSFYSGIASIVLALLCWFVAHQQFQSLKKNDSAIILSATVDINSSPSEGSSRLFVLHEGTKVQIEDKSGDWIEIKLPNGNGGWIKSEDLELI